MRCRGCGKELDVGERRCSYCGTPAGQKPKEGKGGGGGFAALVTVLVLVILVCAGACFLLLTRGPDPAAWFTKGPTPSPAVMATDAGAAGAAGEGAQTDPASPLFPGAAGQGLPFGGEAGGNLLLRTPIPALPGVPAGSPAPGTFATAQPDVTPDPAKTVSPAPAATTTPMATVTPKQTAKPTATLKATAKPTATPKVTAKPTATPLPDAQHAYLEGLILAGFERKLTREELKDLTKFELQVVRNGMYALSGLKFPKNEALRQFYEACSWYDPNETNAETVYGRFNDYQTANVATIVKIETEKGYR